jgi:transmembrane sensor
MNDIATPVERLADRAAADWLLAHDRGLSPAERRAFEAWLARSPAHVDAWARANALWSAFELESDPAVEALLTSARAMRPSIFNTASVRIAAALVVAVLLGAGALVWRQVGRDGQEALQVARNAAPYTHYAAGETAKTVQLADGTDAILDVGSQIEVRQSAQRRELRLTKGQVFLTVAHDPARPFIVAAGDSRITDIGTAFGVSLRPTGLAVVLASGQVRVERRGPGAQTADLAPGQQYVAQDGRPGVVSSVNVEAKLAWRTGQMELNDTPLGEAVAELNRHNPVLVSVADDKVAGLKLTGRYRLDDPEGFTQSIAAIYPVQVRKRAEGGFEIRSR